jgi:hypothetical protein
MDQHLAHVCHANYVLVYSWWKLDVHVCSHSSVPWILTHYYHLCLCSCNPTIPGGLLWIALAGNANHSPLSSYHPTMWGKQSQRWTEPWVKESGNWTPEFPRNIHMGMAQTWWYLWPRFAHETCSRRWGPGADFGNPKTRPGSLTKYFNTSLATYVSPNVSNFHRTWA